MLTRMLSVFIAVSAIAMTSERTLAQSSLPTQTYNLAVNPPTCAAGSTCDNLSVASTAGAIFRDDFNTWSLISNGDQGITFNLTLAEQAPIVWKMSVAACIVQGKPDCAFSITANGKVVVENYADTNDGFHPVQFEIDPTVLVAGQNTITVALEEFSTTQWPDISNRRSLSSSSTLSPSVHLPSRRTLCPPAEISTSVFTRNSLLPVSREP